MGFEEIPKKEKKDDKPDFSRFQDEYSDEVGERKVDFDKLDNPDDSKPKSKQEGKISAKEAIEKLKKRVEKEKNTGEN